MQDVSDAEAAAPVVIREEALLTLWYRPDKGFRTPKAVVCVIKTRFDCLSPLLRMCVTACAFLHAYGQLGCYITLAMLVDGFAPQWPQCCESHWRPGRRCQSCEDQVEYRMASSGHMFLNACAARPQTLSGQAL